MSTEAMHNACVTDNRKNNGVLKAFRMAGWCAYRPTPSGLVKIEDDDPAYLIRGPARSLPIARCALR